MRVAPGLLALLLAAAGSTRAQGELFESDEQFQAVIELGAGGEPLYRRLFVNAWPTSPPYERLTRALAGEPAERLISSFLASGAGLAITHSAYEEHLLRRLQEEDDAVRDADELLLRQLTAFKSLSGYTGRIPPTFDPTFIPVRRARATLARDWQRDRIATWRWGDDVGDDYTLAGLGFALVAEVAFAERELTELREEDRAGQRRELVGSDPEAGFFALVALHSALAKVWELRRLLLDSARRRIEPPVDRLERLNELQHYVVNDWTTKVTRDGTEHAVGEGRDAERSHLRAQAALLLGASRLAALIHPEREGPVADLFRQQTIGGEKVEVFGEGDFEQVVETALFLFRSIRSQHVDVKAERPRSISLGRTIAPTDVGLYLMAIRAFERELRLPTRGDWRDALPAELAEEQLKARRLAAVLGRVLLLWEEEGAGFYDTYQIANDNRAAATKSLETQALVVRGLIAAHESLAGGAARSDHLAAAARVVAWLDSARWDAEAQAYVEGGSARRASLAGAASVLGALREMALTTNDGRYLLRYKQYLESLHDRGFFVSPDDRRAPALASEFHWRSK